MSGVAVMTAVVAIAVVGSVVAIGMGMTSVGAVLSMAIVMGQLHVHGRLGTGAATQQRKARQGETQALPDTPG
ncbi:hypothetical protein T31B1_03135 [Salinisphaera sp. T31B1]